MILDSRFDHEDIVLKARRARDVAVASALRQFGAWVASFFKGVDRSAPSAGKTA